MTRVSRAAISRAVVFLCLSGTSAFASSEDAEPAPQPDAVITARKPAVKRAIDRKTYKVDSDVTAANGSVADALRNLPSVDVDVDGNVSLRGDANVQILIDGKPAVQFSGANRAQALQQMAAGAVDSIEVMTNPSAEFSPDGTGGIINLVTKKIRKPGLSGSLLMGGSSSGRWNLNGLMAYTAGPLNLSGGLGIRQEAARQSSGSAVTRVDPITGGRTGIVEDGRHGYEVLITTGQAALDYDLTPQDRLTLSGNVLTNDGLSQGRTTQVRSDTSGQVLSDLDIVTRSPYGFDVRGASLIWRHGFAGDGQILSVSARLTGVGEYSDGVTDYISRLGAGSRREARRTRSRQQGNTLSVTYSHPLSSGGTLKAGYEYRRDTNDNAQFGGLYDGAGHITPMPEVTNRFFYTQSNHQLYATWQVPLGELTALAGLRLEQAEIDYEQTAGNITGSNAYTDLHPSLHLQYALKDTEKLTLSYSHRVSRPAAYQLNPFVRRSDDFNASAGNPDLRPQETHAIEADWERHGKRVTLNTGLYWRQSYNTIGEVDRFLTPEMALHTYENQGTSISGGLELDLTGKAWTQVSWHLNGNLAYNRLRRTSEAGGETRSAFAQVMKGSIDYRLTGKDLIQLSGNWSGRQITAQGYRLPNGVLNLGYRRKLRGDLVLIATVADVFDSRRRIQLIDTPAIFGRSYSAGQGRIVSFSLTRQLGGKPSRDTPFEYGE